MPCDLFVTEDFAFRGEVDEHKQMLMHMEVNNWSPSVLKRMQGIAKDGLEALHKEGFKVVYCVTDNPKLVQMVCEGISAREITIDGKLYEVIVWA